MELKQFLTVVCAFAVLHLPIDAFFGERRTPAFDVKSRLTDLGVLTDRAKIVFQEISLKCRKLFTDWPVWINCIGVGNHIVHHFDKRALPEERVNMTNSFYSSVPIIHLAVSKTQNGLKSMAVGPLMNRVLKGVCNYVRQYVTQKTYQDWLP